MQTDADLRKRPTIPGALMLVVDDVGWWQPIRSRYHVDVPEEYKCLLDRPTYIEDFRSLVELGKRTGMRILCGLTIGEWDRKRRIAALPHASRYGSEWTNAETLKREYLLDETRDYLNENGEYVEFAVHGLNHMYWNDAGECEFAEYYRYVNGDCRMLPPDTMRRHLDAWFGIYGDNGFSQKVDKLIPCCFHYRYSEGDDEMSYILKDYGIRWVSTPFSCMRYRSAEKPVDAAAENGILTTDRTDDFVPWYKVAAPVPDRYKQSCFGSHWPHFFAMDPQENMDTVKRWAEYFNACGERYGVWKAPDHERAAAQTFYKRFTALRGIHENTWELDFTQADRQRLPRETAGNAVMLQTGRGLRLACETAGCRAELTDFGADHITWRITRPADVTRVTVTAAE